MGVLFFAAWFPAAGFAQGTSTQQNPTVTFATPGTKQVTLKVCTDAGLCDTVTKTVVVLDPTPHIVSMDGVPALVGAGQTVTLSAGLTGRPTLNSTWVITGANGNVTLPGDPATWNTQTPGIGTYQVSLQVQNADGAVSSLPVTVDVERMSFADVPPTYWAWSYVETIYAQGITSGCGTNPLVYCPGNSVSRAEMAVFLGRALHGSTFVPPTPTGIFADVATSFWAAGWIEQLYTDGLTTGCILSPLSYCPGNSLTRAETAVFLLRARHGATYVPPPATGTKFSDVPVTYWAAAWIEQLATEGITQGCGLNPARFCPDDTVNRDQMAAFLVRTFSL